MKRILLLMLLLMLPCFSTAQDSVSTEKLARVRDLIANGRHPEARTEVVDWLREGCPEVDKADAYRELARTYWIDRNYPKTRETLRQIVERYPRSPVAGYALWLTAHTYLKEDDGATAVEYFEEVLNRYPDCKEAEDSAARLAFVYTREKLGTLEDQIERFDSALVAFPDHPEKLELKRAYANLLWARSEVSKTPQTKREAEEAFRTLAALSDSNPEMRAYAEMNLVALTMEQERIREDMREEGVWRPTFVETISECDRFLEDNRDAPVLTIATVMLIKGESLYFNGKYEDAVEVLNEIQQRYVSSSAVATQVAFSWYMKGLALERLGKTEEAYSALFRTLEYPDEANFAGNNVQATALEWLGSVAIKNGDPELAQQVLAAISDFYQDSPETERLRSLITRINAKKEGEE